MVFPRLTNLTASALFVLLLAAPLCAQSGVRPRPTPKPDEEETESVYVEEVRVPVFAFDEKGNFEATLAVDDVAPSRTKCRSRSRAWLRTPASVVLLLGTGWDLDPIGRATTTRDVALSVIQQLREGDSLAVVQSTARWTRCKAGRAINSKPPRRRSKLFSGEGSNLSRGVRRAVELLSERPVGNRHLVIVTDGIDTAGSKDYEDAKKRLVASQTTLHVISYTEVAREGMKRPWWKAPPEAPGAAQARATRRRRHRPDAPARHARPGINPHDVNSGITFDPALRAPRRPSSEMQRASAPETLTEDGAASAALG